MIVSEGTPAAQALPVIAGARAVCRVGSAEAGSAGGRVELEGK